MSETRAPFDSIAVLRRGWRLLLVGLAAGSLLAAVYALLAPAWYQSHLSILAMSPSRSQLGMVFGAMTPDFLPPEIGGGAADSERISTVLRSASVADSTIEKFDLVKRYEVRQVEKARKRLWQHCQIRVERKSGLVTLSCEDTDPQTARDIVEHMGQVGNQVFRRVTRSSASEERRFLEERVAQARAEKEAASRKLRAFQEQNGIVDITEQSRAVIASMARLRGDLMEKELQLDYLKRYSAADEGTVMQLRSQVAVMRAKLGSLEEKLPDASGGDEIARDAGVERNVFPPVMSVPRLRFELEQLLADQKVAEAIFLVLTQRYEMAKVNEARDTSTFQVLDAPAVPEIKIRPRRTLIVVYGAGLGLLAAAAWLLGRARWRWQAASPAV